MEIVKEKRRTIKLTLTDDGNIKIHAPNYTTTHEINSFINSKKNWITKRQKKLNEYKKPCFKTLREGDKCLYMGKLYTLQINTGKKTNITIERDNLILNKRSPDLDTKETLIKCYKLLAKDILPDRVHIHAMKMSYKYNQIRIKSSKTRWGSCSSKKNINLNWALLMAPMNVLDYVVIHELCHLKEMNHSRKFWDLVKKYDPNYKEHINWLKNHQHWLKI